MADESGLRIDLFGKSPRISENQRSRATPAQARDIDGTSTR